MILYNYIEELTMNPIKFNLPQSPFLSMLGFLVTSFLASIVSSVTLASIVLLLSFLN